MHQTKWSVLQPTRNTVAWYTRGIHSPIVQGIMHMRRATIYAISVQYQCTDVQTLLTCFEITCVSSYTAMAQGHALNQELFEDWLSSGKNWMQSACYLNHVRSKTQKKKGTYVMKPKAWLKDRYGADQVDSIIATKEHLQSSRKAGDPTWAMDNPDLPGDKDARFNFWLLLQNSFVDPAPDPNIKNSTVSVFNMNKKLPNLWASGQSPLATSSDHFSAQDNRLYRVFDALVFEDDEENKWETGFNTGGTFSEDQTKELGFLVMNEFFYCK